MRMKMKESKNVPCSMLSAIQRQPFNPDFSLLVEAVASTSGLREPHLYLNTKVHTKMTPTSSLATTTTTPKAKPRLPQSMTSSSFHCCDGWTDGRTGVCVFHGKDNFHFFAPTPKSVRGRGLSPISFEATIVKIPTANRRE